MRLLYFLILLFITKGSAANSDTIYLKFNIQKYYSIANNRLKEIIENERKWKNSSFASFTLTNKYSIEAIKVLSIPVFKLNSKANDYKCGDNIENLINFLEDPYFQGLIIFSHKKIIREGEIIDSYENTYKKEHGIEDNSRIGIYGSPISFDKKQNILKYKLKNPEAFVFLIMNVRGYWCIKNGVLYKLVGQNNLKEKKGNKFFSEHYGEEFIHDAVNNSFRVGIPYYGCNKKEKYDFKKIFFKLNIVDY